MEIPHEKLSSEALRGIIEEFITREGTDYGSVELSLEAKVTRLERQIRDGRVRIVFDPESETCDLRNADELRSSADDGAQAEH